MQINLESSELLKQRIFAGKAEYIKDMTLDEIKTKWADMTEESRQSALKISNKVIIRNFANSVNDCLLLWSGNPDKKDLIIQTTKYDSKGARLGEAFHFHFSIFKTFDSNLSSLVDSLILYIPAKMSPPSEENQGEDVALASILIKPNLINNFVNNLAAFSSNFGKSGHLKFKEDELSDIYKVLLDYFKSYPSFKHYNTNDLPLIHSLLSIVFILENKLLQEVSKYTFKFGESQLLKNLSNIHSDSNNPPSLIKSLSQVERETMEQHKQEHTTIQIDSNSNKLPEANLTHNKFKTHSEKNPEKIDDHIPISSSNQELHEEKDLNNSIQNNSSSQKLESFQSLNTGFENNLNPPILVETISEVERETMRLHKIEKDQIKSPENEILDPLYLPSDQQNTYNKTTVAEPKYESSEAYYNPLYEGIIIECDFVMTFEAYEYLLDPDYEVTLDLDNEEEPVKIKYPEFYMIPPIRARRDFRDYNYYHGNRPWNKKGFGYNLSNQNDYDFPVVDYGKKGNLTARDKSKESDASYGSEKIYYKRGYKKEYQPKMKDSKKEAKSKLPPRFKKNNPKDE